jgi:hypothetical protein
MPRAGFEPATPETKRLQTYVLDQAATGIGRTEITLPIKALQVTYGEKLQDDESHQYLRNLKQNYLL